MAGRSLGSLLIKIGANTYEFQRALETSQKKMQQFSTSLNEVGKSMSLAVTTPLTAIAGVSVHLADVQAKAEAKVEQSIKSTSGAAKLNAEQLKKYASELQGKTLFGDEKILNDVTAQLLTFTNVVGDNFKRAQAVALDLSTVLGSDLKGSAIQLGKALNNPVKGLSALSRSGIQFSAEQEEVIKKMATTGRLAEAQALMLNELERQYGGQAAAAAKVGTGALVQLKNAWGDFLEQIGAAIMPTLNLVVKALQGLVNRLQSLSPTTKQVVVVIGGLAAAIGPVLLGLGSVIKLLPLVKTGFAALVSPLSRDIALFTFLTAAIKSYYDSIKQFENIDYDVASNLVKGGTYKQGDQDNLKSWNERDKAELQDLKKRFERPRSQLSAKDYYAEKKSLEGHIRTREHGIKILDDLKNSEIKIADEIKSVIDSIENTFDADLNLGITTSGTGGTGDIAELTKEIDKLEAKKNNASGGPDVFAKYNTQIQELQKQQQFLNTVTEKYLEMRRRQAESKPIASNDGVNPQVKLPDSPIKGLWNIPSQLETTLKVRMEGLENVTGELERLKELMNFTNNDGEKDSLKQRIKLLDEYVVALGGIPAETASGKKHQDQLNDSLYGMSSIMSNLSGILGDAAAQWLQYFANVLNTIPNLITQFGALAAAKSAAAVADIPIVGPILAAGAITSTLVALASIPKLAKGGLAGAPTLAIVGDNPNAAIDPEVIAPLSTLQRIMQPSGIGGTVEFVIRRDRLVGLLKSADKRNSRIG